MDFGKMVGPLPLGAWLAVVGVGGAVALYSRNSTAAPVPASSDSTTDANDVGDGTTGGWVSTYPGGTGASAGAGDTVTGAPTDNIEWGRRATNALINDGYDAATANSAIQKALASGEAGAMSVTEWTLWRVALMKLGAPPEPVYISEPSSAPGPVDSGTPPEPQEDYDRLTGNASSPTPADLAVWQAEYDATHGIDNPLQALAYWKGTYRTTELMNYYAQRFISTHGGIH